MGVRTEVARSTITGQQIYCTQRALNCPASGTSKYSTLMCTQTAEMCATVSKSKANPTGRLLPSSQVSSANTEPQHQRRTPRGGSAPRPLSLSPPTLWTPQTPSLLGSRPSPPPQTPCPGDSQTALLPCLPHLPPLLRHSHHYRTLFRSLRGTPRDPMLGCCPCSYSPRGRN